MRAYLFLLFLFNCFPLICTAGSVVDEAKGCGPCMVPLREMGHSPTEIQRASRAVIRLGAGSSRGTGFLISETGRMLTNEHVIGHENCTRQGCFVELDFGFEAGGDWKQVTEAYAVPISADRVLDMALFQLYSVDSQGRIGKPFSSRVALTLASEASDSDRKPTYLVGHPEGGLKRWTKGQVYRTQGQWRDSTHCCLSGNSGSPLLNDQGQLVGLVHRGADVGREMVSLQSIRNGTTYSSLPALRQFVGTVTKAGTGIEDWPSIGIGGEVGDDVSDSELPHALLARRLTSFIPAAGKKRRVSTLDFFHAACLEEVEDKEASKDPDFEFPECQKVFAWLNCNDPTEGSSYKGCPNRNRKAEWLALFVRIRDSLIRRNQDPLFWITEGPGAFEPSKTAAKQLIAKRMRDFFGSAAIPLSIDHIAKLVAATEKSRDLIFRGEDLLKALKNYQSYFAYEQSYGQIGKGLLRAFENGFFSVKEFSDIFPRFLADPRGPVVDKIELEAESFILTQKHPASK